MDFSEAGAERPRNEKDAALEAERRAGARREQMRRLRRDQEALADAAELRALDAAAFALHVRMPGLFDGAIRVLWNGWLEDWREFYEVYGRALEETREPLSEASRARLSDYREVLEAFEALLDFASELEERVSQPGRRLRRWRDTAFVVWRAAGFTRRHGEALMKIRASRRQLEARYPSLERFTVPSGVTTH